MATASGSSTTNERRKQLEVRVKKYFIQLTEGCGVSSCDNPHCATGSGNPLSPTKAATKAMSLVKSKSKDVRVCLSKERLASESNSKGVMSLNLNSIPPSSSTTNTLASHSTNSDLTEPMETTDSSEGVPMERSYSNCGSAASSGLVQMNSSSSSGFMDGAAPQPRLDIPRDIGASSSSNDEAELAAFLNEETVHKLISQCQKANDPDYKELTNRLWLVFSSPESLNQSFTLPPDKLDTVAKQTGIEVDLKAVRRTYTAIFDLDCDRIQNTLVNALDMYRVYLQSVKSFTVKKSLSHVVILLENPLLPSPEFLKTYTKILQCVDSLPMSQKESLIRWYSHYSPGELLRQVRSLQQLITIQLLFAEQGDYARYYIPQSDPAVEMATSAMGIFYFANLLMARKRGAMKEFNSSLNSFVAKVKAEFLQSADSSYEQLILRLQVHPCLVREFPIATGEFINEELNGKVDMARDYQRKYGNSIEDTPFAFLEHPFVLSVTNKVEKLYRDNIVSMYSERHRAVIHSVLTGVADNFFLVLRINRDTIMEDALVQLEAIADLNPIDLRKQLRVEFNGEDGVDEGGLQKEFFQLLVEKLFDPVYGLFNFDESTEQHWINPNSLESEGEYKLIGLLLGLAIYNNIILDIRFPVVIYRKLLGCPVDFSDLSSSHPTISRSLQSLLDIPEDDTQKLQELMITFEVSQADMFGSQTQHDLKENGKTIPVTKDNRQEFVELYTDWLLNSSIQHKFAAFKQGFDLVMSQSNLADLVIAEELELIICGSSEWDIDALEESTRYDGFTPKQPVVVNFWEIVREFSESQRKRLLAFITGSDRIPLGGLSKLKLIIVKNGPDSDRLPTAHTCFNALLLCDYSSKEKLKDRLVKAISNSKGFGMI